MNVHHVPDLKQYTGGLTRADQTEQTTLWGPKLLLVIILIWASSVIVGFETALAVLTILGFGLAIIGYRTPAIAFWGISILCTLDPAARVFVLGGDAFFLRWNNLNYLLLFITLINLGFFLRLNNIQVRLIEMLGLLMIIQILPSTRIVTGLQQSLSFISVFGLLIVIARVRIGIPRIWYWMGLINGTIAAIGNIVFYLEEHASLIDHNSWSHFGLGGVIACYLGFRFSEGQRRSHIYLLLLMLINAMGVFLSNSRGVTVMTACILAAFTFELRRFDKSLGWVALCGLLILSTSLLFPEETDITLERFQASVDSEQTLTKRTDARYDIALGAWHMFQENPMGIGTGMFRPTWAELGDLGGRLQTRRVFVEKAAHGAWFLVLAENGFFGVLLLGLFVVSFTISGWPFLVRRISILGFTVTITLFLHYIHAAFQSKAIWFLAASTIYWLHSGSISAQLDEAIRRQPIRNPFRSRVKH